MSDTAKGLIVAIALFLAGALAGYLIGWHAAGLDYKQQAITHGVAEYVETFDADGNKTIEFRWKEQR